MLDQLARRYNRRPSELIGLTDEWIAFDFDAAIALRGAQDDAEEMKKAPKVPATPQRGGGGRLGIPEYGEGIDALKLLVNRSRMAKGLPRVN